MTATLLDSTVVIPDGVLYQSIGEEIVLLDLNEGIYYGLDPIGSRIWMFLAEKMTPRQILMRLTEEYDADEVTLEADLLDLVTQLEARKLLERAT